MHPHSMLLRLAFLAALVAAPASVQAEEARRQFDVAAANSVNGSIASDPFLAAVYGQCPADLFRTRARVRASLMRGARSPDETCDGRMSQCFESCRGGDGKSCFRLAQSLQRNPEHTGPRSYETLFTLACAAGDSAGCTNRAAGIRNGGYPDDPFRDAPVALRESCQFRSFKIACRQGDSWGCAMLGQSYRYGEGTRQSAAKAQDVYRKACRLAPDFESCEFAREALREMQTDRPGPEAPNRRVVPGSAF